MTTVAGNRGGAGEVREEGVKAVEEAVLPVEATIPLPTPDPDREATIRAATFYDMAKQERARFIGLLDEAKIALQVKDNHIDTLKLELATERNRYDSLLGAYNEALQDKADLEATLANEQGHHEDRAARLARFEFSRLRRRRPANKRNGNGEPVSESDRSEAALAELASVVAHGKPVLGQPPEGC